MNSVFLNQPVMVFEDPQSCGEGGLLGCHGVVIGVDHRDRTCTVELASGHRERKVPFSVVRDVVGSRGIIDEFGMTANGVYRSRTGRIATFSFHKCDCDVINYDIRLPNDPGLFPRIDVRLPLSLEFVASGDDDEIIVFNLVGPHRKRVVPSRTRYVANVAASPDGRAVAATAYGSNLVSLWTTESMAPVALEGSGYYERAIRVKGKERTATLPYDSSVWHSVAFSRDGSRVAAAGTKNESGGELYGVLKVWRVKDGKAIWSHSESALSYCACVDFHPSNGQIVVGGADNKHNGKPTMQHYRVYVVDMMENSVTMELAGHTSPVRKVVVSPSGELVATSDHDRILLWNAW